MILSNIWKNDPNVPHHQPDNYYFPKPIEYSFFIGFRCFDPSPYDKPDMEKNMGNSWNIFLDKSLFKIDG